MVTPYNFTYIYIITASKTMDNYLYFELEKIKKCTSSP